MSLRLSDKYGVNPAVEQCFVCLGDKGLVLFGRLKGDVEAPRKVCIDNEPCEECKNLMAQGVIFISVRDNDAGSANPHRTGGWVVIRDEAVERMINDEDLLAHILERRVTFVTDTTWDLVGLPRE